MINKYIKIPCNECGHQKRVINGVWLKDIRESAQLTQRQFGELFKVSSPYISDIERNRRECPDNILHGYLTLDKRI